MKTASLPAWAFHLPESLDADLAEFRNTVQRFKAGEISETQFRAVRVPMGIYEQRESEAYMLRVRLPAGGVLPEQMRCLADVAQSFGNGILHVTTRQDIQVHRVLVDRIQPALVSLGKAGLATKGGGGNTVRNITACCDSGVCPEEVFDVAPYAVAVTERFMADPLSFQLPRKYKIALSGCASDCTGATVNDLGFIAKRKDDVEGFAVYVGGGMGGKSRVATLLHDFVPAADAFLIAEGIKRVFDKNGDRKNKHLARLRFLVERIGFNAFRDLYEGELSSLRNLAPAPLQTRPYPHRESALAGNGTTSIPADSAAYAQWRQTNVRPQKQPGFFLVDLPLLLGDIRAGQMAALANVVVMHGDSTLRATQSQNLALRWVSEAELPTLYDKLSILELANPQPSILRNLVACAGAATCRLGICLSRGLAKALTNDLSNSTLDLKQLDGMRIHISGCPNSCGRHLVAEVGLHGVARREEGQLVPHYAVQLGGRVAEGQTRFGVNCATIPAKNVPAFLQELLRTFLRSSDAPNFHRFLDNGGRRIAENLAARYRHVPPFEADNSFYFDWDADVPFSLAGRGPGECSAGVFDLIEVDLASALEALRAGRLYAATTLAARSLLITQGEQPRSDTEALMLFEKHFVTGGLVDRRLKQLIQACSRCASAPNPERVFEGSLVDVTMLVESVKLLYENMDSSLRFKPALSAKPVQSQPTPIHDFRGVVCPLNYVKTKMALAKLKDGQELTVLLDEQGAKNVPESACKDGHTVTSVTRNGDHWLVVIRKG